MPVRKGGASVSVDKDTLAWLREAEKKFAEKAAEANAEPEYEQVPDGKYVARLSKAELTKTQAGKPQVHFAFVVLEGEQEGAIINKWDGFHSDESFKYLARTFKRFGYDIDPAKFKFSKLPEVLAQLTEEAPVTRVQVKTKEDSDFPNVYVNGVVEDYEEDEEENSDEEEEGEIEVGDTVIIEVDGKELEGEVTKINEKTNKVSVKVGKKTHIVDAEDISLPESEDEEDEEEEEESEFSVGDRVTDGEQEGEIKKLEDEEAMVLWDGNKRSSRVSLDDLELVDSEDEEDEEDEEEEVEIEVGMTVEFKEGKKTLQGEIKKINEKTGMLSVKSGAKVYTVSVDDVEIIEEEEEEEEEEEAPPVRRGRGRPRKA